MDFSTHVGRGGDNTEYFQTQVRDQLCKHTNARRDTPNIPLEIIDGMPMANGEVRVTQRCRDSNAACAIGISNCHGCAHCAQPHCSRTWTRGRPRAGRAIPCTWAHARTELLVDRAHLSRRLKCRHGFKQQYSDSQPGHHGKVEGRASAVTTKHLHKWKLSYERKQELRLLWSKNPVGAASAFFKN